MKRITFGELLQAIARYAEETKGFTIGELMEEGGIAVPFRNTITGEVQLIIHFLND